MRLVSSSLMRTWSTPGTRAPETQELLDLARVAFHAHHLHHHLHLCPPLLLHAGEAHEVVADRLEPRALAVVLEALLGGPVEAQGHVLDAVTRAAGRRRPRRASVPLVDSSVEMLWRAQYSIRSKISGSRNGSPRPISIMCSAERPDSSTRRSKISTLHVLLGLFVDLPRAHGAVEVALGRGFDDVLDRQPAHGGVAPQVSPEKFCPVPGAHGVNDPF